MDFKEFLKALGARMKTIREERGMTQTEAAGQALELRSYQRIEGGHGAPSLFAVFQIAHNLKIHPAELLHFKVGRRKPPVEPSSDGKK